MPPPTSSYSVCHNKYYRAKKDYSSAGAAIKLVSLYKPRLYSFGNKKNNKLTATATHKSPKASSVVKNEPSTSCEDKGGEGQEMDSSQGKEPEKPTVIQCKSTYNIS